MKETGEFIGDYGIPIQDIDGELLLEIGYNIHKNTGAVDLQKKLARAVRDWVFTNTDMMQVKLFFNRHQKCATIKRYAGKFHHRQSDYF